MTELDDSLDGSEKCEAFIRDMQQLCRKHTVRVITDGIDELDSLRRVQFEHDSGSGWILDMEDIKRLVNDR